MSTPKSAALTERQLELITRAHLDSNGLIEPLLKLKGGAKLKMIASLSQRGMIAQVGGQWRIKSGNKYDIVITDNRTSPNIPAGGKMEPIA